MNLQPFPGYEDHLNSYRRENTPEIMAARQSQRDNMLKAAEGKNYSVLDVEIDGPDPGQKLPFLAVRPEGAEGKLPMILSLHGGGFMRGKGDPEFARKANISRSGVLADAAGSLVISLDYRLVDDGVHFPAPLLDAHTAYLWLLAHGEAIGGDPAHIGLYGVSAGGAIAEGLALYLRDRNEPMPALTALDCPLLSTAFREDPSYAQMYDLRMGPDNKALNAEAVYLGGYNGATPSYYAFPAFCHDIGGLGPHLILAAEYDTLRDSAVAYARRLLNAGVPAELLVAPRSAHCFLSQTTHPYTRLVNRMIGMSFRRELGLLEHLRR